MSTSAFIISMILGQGLPLGPQPDQKFFDRLLHWREQFETALKEPKEYVGYTHVYSELLGGAHADALYPLGSASERYVLYFGEMSSGGTLMYQKRRGKNAFVNWHLNFLPVKKKRRLVHGTVEKYLQQMGFEISKKEKITASIRRQLSVSGYFASYGFHSEMGGYAKVIQPDGGQTKEYRTSGPFSITPEERSLLSHPR
jgi:hypothetical protein